MSSPLSGKLIIDLSHRLPGPLAGKLLAGSGARVIKIEDKNFKDPFIQGLFAEMDNSFPIWYKHLNKDKEVLRFDFSDKEECKKIQELCLSADGIIMAIPTKLQLKLGVDIESLKSADRPIAIINPKASKDKSQSMHDLNALALTGLLTLHAQTHHKQDLAPPFLPIAGINFGQKMAFDLLATMLKAKEDNTVVSNNSYLFESTQEVFSSFWPEELRDQNLFLHNGLYPCYNIYQTKDSNYVVMACVEEKFWVEFCEAFCLSYTADQRFETDGKIHSQLVDFFSNLSEEEVKEKLGNRDICIDVLHHTN